MFGGYGGEKPIKVCSGTCLPPEAGESGQKFSKGLFSDSGNPLLLFLFHHLKLVICP